MLVNNCFLFSVLSKMISLCLLQLQWSGCSFEAGFVELILSLTSELCGFHEVGGVVQFLEVVSSLLFGFWGNIASRSLDIINECLDWGLVLLQDWSNDEFVNGQCTFSLWSHQEYEECEFDVWVEWNHLENEPEELIYNVEETEDGPVGEPLLIVILSVWLDCLDALDWWINHCEYHCQDCAAE